MSPRGDNGVTSELPGHGLSPAVPLIRGCHPPQMSPHGVRMLLPRLLRTSGSGSSAFWPAAPVGRAWDGAGVSREIKHKLPVLFLCFLCFSPTPAGAAAGDSPSPPPPAALAASSRFVLWKSPAFPRSRPPIPPGASPALPPRAPQSRDVPVRRCWPPFPRTLPGLARPAPPPCCFPGDPALPVPPPSLPARLPREPEG